MDGQMEHMMQKKSTKYQSIYFNGQSTINDINNCHQKMSLAVENQMKM